MNAAVYGSLPASACSLGTTGSFGPDQIVKSVFDAAGQVTQSQAAVGTTDAATEATLTYTNNGKLATLYGNPQATNLGVFGYTGQAWLPSMGIWYYKARVYDPELGRFLQTDPIGGANLYAYTGNDPVNFSDPSGAFSNFIRPNVGISEHISSSLTPHSWDWMGGSIDVTYVSGRIEEIELTSALQRLTDMSKNTGVSVSCLLTCPMAVVRALAGGSPSSILQGASILDAGWYKGVLVFGDNPTRSGSVVGTDKQGGFLQGLSDLEYLSTLNGLVSPNNIPYDELPAYGWVRFKGGTQTGVRNLATGLIGRFDSKAFRIDIPPGLMIAPGQYNNTGLKVVVHYWK